MFNNGSRTHRRAGLLEPRALPPHCGTMSLWLLARLTILFLVFTSVHAVGQDQTTGVRDSGARTVLSESLAAAGGEPAITKIHDFVASGEVTYYWTRRAVKGDVTVRSRGTHQFRLDANLSDGTHSNIVNGPKSLRKAPNGNLTTLRSKAALRVASVTFPLLQVLIAVQDKSFRVSSAGLVTYGGQLAFDILVEKVFPARQDPLAAMRGATKAHIYVDAKSFVIRGIRDTVDSMNGGRGECPDEMQFSDYRAVDGILVPLSITEMIGGQRTMTIQLKQITFNTGLTDSDFE